MINVGANLFSTLWKRVGGGIQSVYSDAVSLWKLDEQSGARYDSIGTNDLTDNNTVTYQNMGPSGIVAQFAKANTEYLSNASLDTTFDADDDSMYFAGWIKPSLTGDYAHYFYIGGNWASAALAVYHDNAAQMIVYTNASTSSPQALTAITMDVWHFVEGWFDKSDGHTYVAIDGGTPVQSALTKSGTASTYSTMTVGKEYGGGWNYYVTGNASRFGIWKTIPDAATRSSLYNSGKGKAYSDLTTAEKVGLVSYWNLDEASGDRADSHGSNTLADNNTVTSVTNSYPANLPGVVANFTAANNEYLTASASLVNGQAAFTVSAWAYHVANSLDELVWDGTTYGVQIETDRDVTCYASATQYEQTTDTGIWPEGQWIHIVYVFDGSQATENDRIKIYINGALITNVSNPVAPPTSLSSAGPFTVGRYPGGGFNWDGLASSIAIWNSALDSAQVAELFNSGDGAPLP